jgi:hypothetical protein
MLMRSIVTACATLICASLMGAVIDAQWLNYPTPGTPRLPDGKPNLSAPTPRTAEGNPDLSGVWTHEVTSVADMKRLYGALADEFIKTSVPGMEIDKVHKYAVNILADFAPAQSPMRPEAAAILRKRIADRDPSNVCMEVPGFPLAGLLAEPIKIVQAPRTTVVLYEAGSLHRQVVTDGRGLPKAFEFPAFLGYSVGHWERDVLVVETAGFNDRTPLDVLGHPHSEALHITERFRRRDFGHLDVEMTFDDSRMYTKPFTVSIPHTLVADGDTTCGDSIDSRPQTLPVAPLIRPAGGDGRRPTRLRALSTSPRCRSTRGRRGQEGPPPRGSDAVAAGRA